MLVEPAAAKLLEYCSTPVPEVFSLPGHVPERRLAGRAGAVERAPDPRCRLRLLRRVGAGGHVGAPHRTDHASTPCAVLSRQGC